MVFELIKNFTHILSHKYIMITAPPTYWIRENEIMVEKRENIQNFISPLPSPNS